MIIWQSADGKAGDISIKNIKGDCRFQATEEFDKHLQCFWLLRWSTLAYRNGTVVLCWIANTK